jgi:hypothetical protein
MGRGCKRTAACGQEQKSEDDHCLLAHARLPLGRSGCQMRNKSAEVEVVENRDPLAARALFSPV